MRGTNLRACGAAALGMITVAVFGAVLGAAVVSEAQAAPPTKQKARPGAGASALKAKPGFIVGRVVDSAGKPLPGVTVGIYGTTFAGENTRFEAETDAAGRFSQRLPDGIYGTTAYHNVRYNDRNYRFTLSPRDGITAKKHDSTRGILKEFVWRISGPKPGEQPGNADTGLEAMKYYGGYVYLTSRQEGFGGDRVYFPGGSTLVVTMTPRGKLIDGSTGSVRTFKRAFEKDVTSGISTHMMNIPVGLYTLTARLLLPDGTSRDLGVKMSASFDGPFTPSVNVDFEPTSFNDLQMMQVTVAP